MNAINDLYQAYEDALGSEEPQRTRDELQDEFHARGYGRYERDGQKFLDEIFADGWAYNLDK